MSRKKKILIILHLCFATIYFIWLLTQPYIKEIVIQKSHLSLYTMVFEKEDLLRQLSQPDQIALMEGFAATNEKKSPPLSCIGHHFFISTPPFALGWLFLSFMLTLLLLLKIEGAEIATWLLPLITLGYAYFLQIPASSHSDSLFPSEEYVLTTYVDAENSAQSKRDTLLLGWHRYLVKEWAQEEPNPDPAIFKAQIEKGLFAFNVKRLTWMQQGKNEESILLGFTSSPSLFKLACYFIWNLSFAWFINRKSTSATVVPSAKTL